MNYTLTLTLADLAASHPQLLAVSQASSPLSVLQALTHELTFTIEVDIDRLLAARGEIAILWSVEDVQTIRPGLTDDEQAMQVLQRAREIYDADIGLSWQTLEYAAQELFGNAGDSDEDGERP